VDQKKDGRDDEPDDWEGVEQAGENETRH
jgi:hypothetical protein